jgi:hypothetical protein
MEKKELIEKLEDLATFFTLAASNAEKEQKKESELGHDDSRIAAYYEGRKAAFDDAFLKMDRILKEAKK